MRVNYSARVNRPVDSMSSPNDDDRSLSRIDGFLGSEMLLEAIAAATQPLVEPSEIMATTARLLAEHLRVDRCAYAEVEQERCFVITGDYARGVNTIVGRWEVAAFGPACVRCMLAGEAYVVADVENHSEVGPEHLPAYRATAIRSVICVPLHKNGRFTAAMAVHQSRVRNWTHDEVQLVRLVVARCWETLERSRVARALSESEARYRIMVEAESRARLDYAVRLSGIGFWYCDLPFDQLIWDDQVKTHFFLTPDEPVTINTFYERIHPDDRAATEQAINDSIANHHPYDVVYRTVHLQSGAIKWIRALGGTTYRPDGAPLRFDGVTVDVTAQKLDQEHLAQALEREREQAQVKDHFLATLAHELRNPLAPIRTGLQVLQMTKDPEQAQKTCEMMERQLGHMVRLVDDLLDVSRVTLGKLQLKRAPVDFKVVIASAIETTRSLIESAGHELTLSLPDESMPLDVDPTRLAQVFANLLNNAAKFTPRGGRIQLTAELEPNSLVVRVSDSGLGIPREMLAQIFEMFTQVGHSLEGAQGGLGIGLTLVRRIVEMHGGSVSAESDGRTGSTFTVRLPLAMRSRDRAQAGGPAQQLNRATKLRVLVVDDNEDGAEMLAVFLNLSGHATRLAHCGREALALVEEFDPHVVFLDIGLPDMSGYDVARALRSRSSAPQPRLVAVTGWGTEEDRRRAQHAGFDDHLVKPVDTKRVSLLLEQEGAKHLGCG